MSHLLFALMIAWALGLIAVRALIPVLKRLKFGQNIRAEGPKRHLQKSGTPTMGGIAFVLCCSSVCC